MSLLGLPSERRSLLRFPNRGLLPRLSEAVPVVAELMERVKAREVFVVAYEGGHIDHDALNFIVAEADKRSGRGRELYEFPLYNRTGAWWALRWRINAFPPGGPPGMTSAVTPELARLKHAMMRAYVSQRGDMTPFRLCLSERRLLRRGEPYRMFSAQRDYEAPPHPGVLNYERDGHARFEEFRNATLAARSALDAASKGA